MVKVAKYDQGKYYEQRGICSLKPKLIFIVYGLKTGNFGRIIIKQSSIWNSTVELGRLGQIRLNSNIKFVNLNSKIRAKLNEFVQALCALDRSEFLFVSFTIDKFKGEMLFWIWNRAGVKLPDHLQKFMDESGEDGVIFVSFGSVLKAATMSEDQKNALSKIIFLFLFL